MSLVSKLTTLSAAGAERSVEAFLSSRQSLNQDYDPDTSAIVRVGTTDKYAFIYYDSGSRALYGAVVTYTESTNSFSIGSASRLDTGSYTTQPMSPSPVWDEATQSVVILGQGATYYPHIYVCTVSGTSISRSSAYQITTEDIYVNNGPSLFYDQINNKFVAFVYKINSGFRVFSFSLSNKSVTGVSSLTSLGGSINLGSYVPIVHDPINNTFHMFFYHYNSGYINHFVVKYQGGSYQSVASNTFSNAGNNNTQPTGAEYDLVRNKIVVSWIHSYTPQNTYLHYISVLTPTNSGNYYTTDSSNVVSYYSGTASPRQSSYEPLSSSMILFVNGYIYQVVLTTAGAFEELLFIGYSGSSFHFNGGRQIAPFNDQKSILIFGDDTNNFGITLNGKYKA